MPDPSWTEWLSEHAWLAWVVVGLVLAGVEITTLDLIFLMLAVGAVAGAGTAALGAPLLLQVLVAGGSALAMILVARPSPCATCARPSRPARASRPSSGARPSSSR